MRLLASLCLLAVIQPAMHASPSEEYRARRLELSKKIQNGVLVLFGATDKDEDVRSAFFQDPNFYYLSGWREPNAVLLITSEVDSKTHDILFLPPHQPEVEKYTGRKAGPEDPGLARKTGFESVLPIARLESELKVQLERYTTLYTIGDDATARMKAFAPLREVANAGPILARMRLKKSPEEIALIQHSIDMTLEAHRAAWKHAAPGLFEYQIASAMTNVYLDRGCERSAYAPIVGSGPDSVILHYAANSRRIERADLLLMDVGAECAGYAADITRTIPVGAPFTKRQRKIYEIVFGAQNAAIAAVKPDITFRELTKVARDYMDAHGKDLHGDPLGKYLLHGISHHVGLDVHDGNDYTSPLAEGNVVTIEPGIYIPEENIGVRIEDMVLVTKDGAKLLSGALPRDPDSLEKALGH